MNPIVIVIIDFITLIIGVAAGYFFHRYQADQAATARNEKADNILKVASEQARLIESGARDNATKIVKSA
ncbi:MAG: hypothetical protein KAX86_03980, partial [Anaerolineales bacterium]|nr:hypothetical protein [Anaerolineales bacterium]